MAITLPQWVQWVIAVGAIATALTAVFLLFRKLWPALTTFVHTVNALADLPQFMITTAHTLADQDTKIEDIHHEVHYNNGSSVKDAVGRLEATVSENTKRLKTMQGNQSRIERGVKGLYTRVDANELAAVKDRANIAAAQQELETTRPARRRAANSRSKS